MWYLGVKEMYRHQKVYWVKWTVRIDTSVQEDKWSEVWVNGSHFSTIRPLPMKVPLLVSATECIGVMRRACFLRSTSHFRSYSVALRNLILLAGVYTKSWSANLISGILDKKISFFTSLERVIFRADVLRKVHALVFLRSWSFIWKIYNF
jgi:hypothetical protein